MSFKRTHLVGFFISDRDEAHPPRVQTVRVGYLKVLNSSRVRAFPISLGSQAHRAGPPLSPVGERRVHVAHHDMYPPRSIVLSDLFCQALSLLLGPDSKSKPKPFPLHSLKLTVV